MDSEEKVRTWYNTTYAPIENDNLETIVFTYSKTNLPATKVAIYGHTHLPNYVNIFIVLKGFDSKYVPIGSIARSALVCGKPDIGDKCAPLGPVWRANCALSAIQGISAYSILRKLRTLCMVSTAASTYSVNSQCESDHEMTVGGFNQPWATHDTKSIAKSTDFSRLK